MTSGCSMRATLLRLPPQRWQLSISTPDMHLNRCAQFIAAGRGVGALERLGF
jgi:hypothetical protein